MSLLGVVKVVRLGRLSFGQALEVQKAAVANVRESDSAGILLLLEHNPVFTIGIRTKDYTFDDEVRLKKTGAEFYKTNRGGLITFHGPGQLVAYPIMNLKRFKPSMKWYICSLEKTVINMCAEFGLKAATSPHTGVWVGDNKICAMGVHGSRFITSHGLAINCNTDLKWFDHIVPCGIPNKGVTSLSKELNRRVTIDDATPSLLECFRNMFKCDFQDVKNL